MKTTSALYYRHFDGTLRPKDNNELPILERVNHNGRSCYLPKSLECADSNIFRGVSQILSLTQDQKTKEALRRWEKRVGQQESRRIRNQAIRVGNAIHADFRSYLTTGHKTQKLKFSSDPYFRALNKVLPNFGDALLSEQYIVSFQYRYFGQLDHFGLYRDNLTLSDLKTSLKPKSSLNWIQDKILQLAAYLIPLEELYPVEKTALIYLISDGSFNEFVFSVDEMESYKEMWFKKLYQVSHNENLAA